MKKTLIRIGAIFAILSTLLVHGATLYVDLHSANPMPPYSDWSTAATKIQDAIDASTDGDQIWVTNGVYQAGGKVMAGNLTNRVALTKAVTVQSVNGPFVTTIAGAGATNGNAAIRCAWLTNNAALVGFTLTRGATRTGGEPFTLQAGGGVWCASSNAAVSECIIISNIANFNGPGAYQGTLDACFVTGNKSPFGAVLSAIYLSALNNCTVVSNAGYGILQCQVTNSIVFFNTMGNYNSSSFSYSCTTPSVAGTGNLTNAPLFFVDGIHLLSESPCVQSGTAAVASADIFNAPWANPPSMGCADVAGAPLVAPPKIHLTSSPVGFTIGNYSLSGTGPFTFNWLKDGSVLQDNAHFSSTQSTNLVAAGVTFHDFGGYQLVASNSFGATTSDIVQVVIHCVDLASPNPVAPYTNWLTAATNIQDAINAAAAGEIVLVTNGVYSQGGKVISGDLTNRVALDKALSVVSINGYANTVIEGQWDSVSTNGPGAVRTAWLTNGATLYGFTLRNGATRGGNFITLDLQYGGGAWLSTNAVVSNCVLTNNSARYAGGGAVFGTVLNSFMSGNTVQLGYGGGAYQVRLNNCTIRENHCFSSIGGAGVDSCDAKNCIIVDNYFTLSSFPDYQLQNYSSGSLRKFTNCCTSPLPAGDGNISASPIFLDTGFRLAPSSPGRAAGSALYATGNDLDNEPFNNPPSMGCDEFVEANQTGPLSFTFVSPWTATFTNFSIAFATIFDGNVSQLEWSFGDGTILTNAGYFARHAWTNTGLYTVTLTAYNLDHPEGVSSNFSVFVDTLASPTLAAAGVVNNCFQFTFQGQTNGGYVVQYATNLVAPVSWQFLTSSFSPGGAITIQDPSVTNTTGARFYRVQILP